MASKTVVFEGRVAWAKVYQPDDTKWGQRWSVDVYLEGDELAKFKATGAQLEPIKKPLFEGMEGYRFRRDKEKLIKGKIIKFGSPEVVDADGKPMTALIGNGSVAKVAVCFYDTVQGMGHRMEGIKVLEHVPYENLSFDRDEEHTTKVEW